MAIARIEDGWVKCAKCGHKLARVISGGGNVSPILEIKCHSCKTLNDVVGNAGAEDEEDNQWVFTFCLGSEHQHHGKYVVINGTYEEAREKMIAIFGTDWAFQYSLKEYMEYVTAGESLETPLKVEEIMSHGGAHYDKS